MTSLDLLETTIARIAAVDVKIKRGRCGLSPPRFGFQAPGLATDVNA